MELKSNARLRWLPGGARCLLAAFFIFSFVLSSFGQKVPISGTVTDARGSALPGVSISLKGTTTGTITDIDGNYSIDVNSNDDILVFSMVGLLAEEVRVGDLATINITLIEDLVGLDEVVVIGYGAMKKKLSTGANSHVSSDELEKKHSLRLEQSLQGLTPGVQITANSGQPGSNFKVRIRGVGTIGNADPLYIVDGVPTDVSYLNPNDIESVDILKDAASAAIYGAEAANGVVLITTKKGKAGETHISFDSYYGVQNVPKKLDLLSSKDYMSLVDEAMINSNRNWTGSEGNINSLTYLPELDADGNIVYDANGNIIINQSLLDTIPNTNWQDYLFRKNAPIQSHTLTISGGSESSIYSASVSYFAQDGIVGTHDQSFYDRISVRLNSEHKLYKDLVTFGENLTFAHSTSNGVGTGNIYGNAVRGFINASPVYEPYSSAYPDGYGRNWRNPTDANPLAAMYYSNLRKNADYKLVGDLYFVLEPIKGLSLKTDYGVDVYIGEYNSFRPVYELSQLNTNIHSTASMGINRNFKYNWENTATYKFSLGKNNFTILAGNTVREQTWVSVGGNSYDLVIADLDHAILSNGTNDTLKTNYGTKGNLPFLSYFGRINYNYNEKYLLTAIIRRDGSSKFGPDNRFGNFKSISAGWILTQEEFFKFKGLDFFKVRASWGQNGNDNLPAFSYESLIAYDDKNYYFGNPQQKYTGAVADKIPNATVKWEAATQTDIGFDARFLKSFSLAFDWYNKVQKDWLVTSPVPELLGILNTASYPTINGGDVRNRGIEVALAYYNSIGDFNFSINGNISYNTNKVLNVPSADSIIHGESSVLYNGSSEFYRTQDGYPIGYFYGYETAGIFQDTAEIRQYANDGQPIQPSAKPGDVRFVDTDGDGKITSNDRTMIGSPLPKYTFGISFNAEYKGFDLSVFVQGVSGNDIVNCVRPMDNIKANWTSEALERWHGPGTSDKFPRLVYGSSVNWTNISDLYIQDGSFLKVRSINLGYDLAQSILKGKIAQCRLYVSVVNAFTFTKYNGYDPEIGYGDYDGNRYANFSTGIDIGTYPQSRQYLVGLGVKF